MKNFPRPFGEIMTDWPNDHECSWESYTSNILAIDIGNRLSWGFQQTELRVGGCVPFWCIGVTELKVKYSLHTHHTHTTRTEHFYRTRTSLSLSIGGRGEGGGASNYRNRPQRLSYKKHNIQKQAKYIDKTTRKTLRFLGKFVVDLEQTCRAYLPLNIRL